jgi:hypothetical protein
LKSTPALTEFQLSRIYAQGWNAARTGAMSREAVFNPYCSEPERSRWQQGFAAASQ